MVGLYLGNSTVHPSIEQQDKPMPIGAGLATDDIELHQSPGPTPKGIDTPSLVSLVRYPHKPCLPYSLDFDHDHHFGK